MDEDRLSLLPAPALPLMPSLLVCIGGIALGTYAALLAGSAGLSLWATTALQDGTSAASVTRLFRMASIPRAVLSAAVLGALVLVALRERPIAPRA